MKYRLSNPRIPSGVYFLKQIIVKQVRQAHKLESGLFASASIWRLVNVIMSHDQSFGEIGPKRATHSRDSISVCNTIDFSVLGRADREVLEELMGW